MDREDISEKPSKPRAVSPRSGAPVPSNPKGRPKGIPNKSTIAVREAIAAFIDSNSSKIQQWADEIYDKKGAEGAFQVFTDLLEYAQPKLARTELQQLDKNGNPADAVTKIEIELVQPKD